MTAQPKTLDFCPYRGLEPYTEEYRRYFFGRERDQKTITSNLHAMPLTVLYGNSGVGKSSVLMAGVVPQLKKTPRLAVVVFRNWQGDGFIQSLKQEVLRAVKESASGEVEVDLSLPFDKFLRACNEALGGPIFFIFDQFEEYFLYHPPSKADDSFDAGFARAVNRRDIDARFLLSMRGEELSKLDRFRGRIPNILSNMLRLSHLDRVAGERVIREPLVEYNRQLPDEQHVKIEDELVVELLDKSIPDQNDFSQGGLATDTTQDTLTGAGIETPVLQILLTRLWKEEIAQGSRILRLSTYKEKLFGAESIISTYLKEIMERLSEPERAIAASVFRFLVTPSRSKIAQDTTALASFAELDERQVEAVLVRLSSQEMRVLRTVRAAGQPVRYEIFHDVLARAILDWRAAFVQAQEKARVEQRAVEEAARMAKEAAHQLQLEQAQALAEAERQRAEEQQQRVAEQARSAARFRRLSFALATALLLAVGMTIFASVQQSKARTQEGLATSNAREAMLAKKEAEKQAEEARKQAQLANEKQAEAKKAEAEALAAKEDADKERVSAKKQAALAEHARVEADAAKQKALAEKARVVEEQARTAAALKRVVEERARTEEALRREAEANKQAYESEKLAMAAQKLAIEADMLNREAQDLYYRSDYQGAIAKYQEVLQLYEKAGNPLGAGDALVNLGDSYRQQGNLAEAEAVLKRGLELLRTAPESNRSAQIKGLKNLGWLYDNRNRFSEAVESYSAALALQRQNSETEPAEIADTLDKLGSIYVDLRKYTESEQSLKEALEIRKKFGADSPATALSYRRLANSYRQQAKYAEAEPLYRQALEILEKASSTDQPQTAYVLMDMGRMFYEQGRYLEAEPLLMRAVQILEEVLPTSLDFASSLDSLGSIYDRLARYSEAEALYQRSLDIKKKRLDPDSRSMGVSYINLGLVHFNQGKYSEAETAYKLGLDIIKKVGDEKEMATVLNNLAGVYRNQGKYEEAIPLYQQAIALDEKNLGPEHPKLYFEVNGLARTYYRQRRYDEAEPLFKRALAVREKVGGQSPFIAVTLSDLAKLYRDQQRFDEAEPLFQRAIAIYEKALPGHPYLAEALEDYAALLRQTKRANEAASMEARAKEIRATLARQNNQKKE